MENKQDIETWAIVELMGHQKMAGFVTTQTCGVSQVFLRIDGQPGYTRLVNPAAVYAINPCSEELATKSAQYFRPKPIQQWEMPTLPAPATTGYLRAEEDAHGM